MLTVSLLVGSKLAKGSVRPDKVEFPYGWGTMTLEPLISGNFLPVRGAIESHVLLGSIIPVAYANKPFGLGSLRPNIPLDRKTSSSLEVRPL